MAAPPCGLVELCAKSEGEALARQNASTAATNFPLAEMGSTGVPRWFMMVSSMRWSSSSESREWTGFLPGETDNIRFAWTEVAEPTLGKIRGIKLRHERTIREVQN